jgi:biotin/methionine sulfoxide reductase
MSAPETSVRRGYTASHWGVYEVESDAAGRAPIIRGLHDDPDPSPIGLDQFDPQVRRLRIARPAVRRSWLENGPGAATDRRGREPFVEVDWDTALDLVARELRRVRDKHGDNSIFGGSYGWASAGRFHHAQSQAHRFLNQGGGYVRSVDSYSLGAGRALMPFVVASMDDLILEHSSWDVLAEHTELFVAFGGLPLKNTQVAPGGAGRHRARGGLKRMAEAGVRFVNVSPLRDGLVTGGEVEWIPIRPNTDTAMMLGLAYVIHQDNRFDRTFLDRCTTGFDSFLPYLTGVRDGVAKTPQWAAEITGVPAERIESLGREMLGRRTVVNASWSLQRAAHGEQPFWMLVTLASMIGQVGLPGGGYGLGYGAMNTQGSAHARVPGPRLPQGRNPVADFIPVARVADMLLGPGEPFTYQGRTHRYPDIRLVYWAGGNPFHHHQDLNRLVEAWKRPETIVVHEQYWTPVARYADVVLPATIALERDDIGTASREGLLIAMRKAAEPYAESRDDYAIFAGLAERLGFGEQFTERLDPADWLERLYNENLPALRAAGIELPTFAAFWEQGLAELPPDAKPLVMHEDFRRDPEANPLQTRSGKIEIYSETIAGFGLADCPGYPVWIEPFEWLGHEKAGAFPLHLLSDQPVRRLHSQLDQSPYSRAGKVAGREPVHLSRADAAARGIADGDVVELFNDRGRCLAGAVVSDDVMPGVVRLATGSWFDPGDGLERNGNPNSLTLDRGSSSFGQGCAAHTCLVEARRFDGPAPPVRAYEPPAIVPLAARDPPSDVTRD